MTAEVAILNKEAVALAADSAVTLTERKIFTSINKIFALSRYNPVGIMIYGSAEFMEMPWETLIKLYRKKLGNEKFNSLKDYTKDFIEFLSKEKRLFSALVQKDHFARYVYYYLLMIRENIEHEVENLLITKKKVSDKDIKSIVSKVIRNHHKIWEKAEKLSNLPKSYINDLEKKYGKVISDAIKNVFEKLPISKNLSMLLKNITISLFTKFNEGIGHPGASGVVITGFGEKDLFPSLQSFKLEGFVENYLKFNKLREVKISPESSALIMPFAQSEMVHSFMEGVTRDYEVVIENYLSLICNNYPQVIIDALKGLKKDEKQKLKKDFKRIGGKQLKALIQKLDKYRRNRYVDPVINVVAFLPKDELAAMAESLINLTSFRKRVTIEPETVAGPIDVAVISKGDGFIWIKRKHYFRSELNPQFLTRYKKEAVSGKK